MGSMFILLLPWKMFSVLFSTYASSTAVTPLGAGPVTRGVIYSILTTVTMFVQLLPLDDYPIINFFNTLFSIHSQIHTLYISLKLSSQSETYLKISIVLYLLSVLSITQTLYQLIQDWEQINTRELLS